MQLAAGAAGQGDALLLPCLAAAGLPQDGGPRRLDQIDTLRARALCAAAQAAAGDSAALVSVLLGRVAQAAGDAGTARRAYEAGMAAGVPRAFGLAAHLFLAPPPGAHADIARAEELALAGAAAGDWLSAELLALVYARGLVPGRDAADAFRLAAPLAHEGSAVAQFFVGQLHLAGAGAAQSDPHAARWFERAAAQGYGPAMVALAGMIERGRAGPADAAAALALYREAAAAGDAGARDRLTLQLGERSGELVRLLQEEMRAAGLYSGRIDGQAGAPTREAARAFIAPVAAAP